MKRILILVLALFLIPTVSAVGSNTTLGFAGSILDITTGNYTKGATNITLNISTSDSCTANVIYSEKFSNNVSDGVFSLLAGYYEEHLNLEYGRDYWSCYEITNGTFTERFGADPFTAGKGLISAEDVNLSITYLPTTINTTGGTLDAGNIISVQFYEDDDTYNVSEDSGANALNVEINWTGVSSFDNIVSRHYYDGAFGHEIIFEIWHFGTSSWEELIEITDMNTFNTVVIFVGDPTNHIGVNGNVSVRYRHVQNGNPTHNLFLDYVVLVEGFTTITAANHDSLGGRESTSNHPWAFPTDASRNITAQLNGTSASFTDDIFLDGAIYDRKDTDRFIDFNASLDFIEFAIGRASTDIDLIMESTTNGADSPAIFPESGGKGYLGRSDKHWNSLFVRTGYFRPSVLDDDIAIHVQGLTDNPVLRYIGGSGSIIASTYNSSSGTTEEYIHYEDYGLSSQTQRFGIYSDGSMSFGNMSTPVQDFDFNGSLNATEEIYEMGSDRVCTGENGLCNDSTNQFWSTVSWGDGVEGVLGAAQYNWYITGASREFAITNFYVPDDYVSRNEMYVAIVAGGNGFIDYTLSCDFGAVGEQANTHIGASGPTSIISVANQIYEIDLAACLNGLLAQDYVGVKISDAGAPARQDFYVLGVMFKYY